MNFKKTIAIDARFMLRPLRGIPLYVLKICENLPALNNEYKFIYFINKGFEHNDTYENYFSRISNIENNNSNVTFVNLDDDAEIKWEQVFLRKMIKQYNVNLLHIPANRVCFFPGIPTVTTVHDAMEYLYLLDEKYPLSREKNKSVRMFLYHLRKRLYTQYTYRYALKHASKIITVSHYSAKQIINYLSVKIEKLTVIHHGVDDDYLKKDPISFEKRKFTLMLGGDSLQKNPEAALRCWAKVNPALRNRYPLKIVGFCGSDSSPLLRAVKDNGLENSVEIHGWVTQDEIVNYFQSAALFFFPSQYEGFGFPLLQAMASGTPVISTTKASIPEVLGDVGYQFDPRDHEGMADATNKVLSSAQEWQRQSDAGRKRSNRFSWQESARKHLRAYEELL
jgi:glycosyltransferase involved in cell wall biosynthesis